MAVILGDSASFVFLCVVEKGFVADFSCRQDEVNPVI